MKKIINVLFIIFVLYILVNIFLVNDYTMDKASEILRSKSIHECYEVKNHVLNANGNLEFNVFVTDDYHYLKFEVTFYDEQRNILDSVIVKKTNLEYYETYKFNI